MTLHTKVLLEWLNTWVLELSMSAMERLGIFLDKVKLPVQIKAAATVSGMSEEQIKEILKNSSFEVIQDKIQERVA